MCHDYTFILKRLEWYFLVTINNKWPQFRAIRKKSTNSSLIKQGRVSYGNNYLLSIIHDCDGASAIKYIGKVRVKKKTIKVSTSKEANIDKCNKFFVLSAPQSQQPYNCVPNGDEPNKQHHGKKSNSKCIVIWMEVVLPAMFPVHLTIIIQHISVNMCNVMKYKMKKDEKNCFVAHSAIFSVNQL